MAHTIIARRLYKEDFLREQTDLPLLVREDTGRFLRERDLVGARGVSNACDVVPGEPVIPLTRHVQARSPIPP